MKKKTLSIIGMGDFGRFMVHHLKPYFEITVFDPFQDLTDLSNGCEVAQNIHDCAKSDIIILAVPVRAMDDIMAEIAPHIQGGQLVIDVASVKVKPAAILKNHLDDNVDIIGLHPLFGPQSGRDGIKGLNIALVNVQGNRTQCMYDFLANDLGVSVFECSADEHDIQVAYAQGLTHMIAKSFAMMNIPEITQKTRTFELLEQMVDLIKHDSDPLVQSILMDNPHCDDVKRDFFKSMKVLEEKFSNYNEG